MIGVLAWVGAFQLPGQGWNFALLFAPGLFMLLAGLAIPLVVRICCRAGAWRAAADREMWFQSRVGLGFVALVAVGFGILALDGSGTVARPPRSFEIIVAFGAILGIFGLPLLEAGRMLFVLVSARGPRIR